MLEIHILIAVTSPVKTHGRLALKGCPGRVEFHPRQHALEHLGWPLAPRRGSAGTGRSGSETRRFDGDFDGMSLGNRGK